MNVAVILAGGSGERLGHSMPKQFYRLAGKMVIEHSLDAFQFHPGIDEIAVVSNPLFIDEIDKICKKNKYSKVKKILEGGKERYQSSLAAINAYDDPDINILIHDAVRPLVSERIISDCIEKLKVYHAVNVGVTPSDTINQVSESDIVTGIPFRRYLKNGQSPQAFKLGTIKKAYQLALSDPEFRTTDDCSVVFNYLPGEKIYVVQGESFNMKLTFREDLYSIEKWLHTRSMGQLSGDLSTRAMKNLLNKVIVVFGGNSDFGNEIAVTCLNSGARVHIISGTKNDEKLTGRDAVKRALKEVYKREGQIDFVINTAGNRFNEELYGKDYINILHYNNQHYSLAIIVARESFQYLRETKGGLLFITSDPVSRGHLMYSLNSSLKAAIKDLTQTLSEEWRDPGIRVNCINPGSTTGPLKSQNSDTEPGSISLKPEEAARIAINTVFSDVTGEIINIQLKG